EEWRRHTVVALRRLGICALWLGALASLPLAFERRRIAHPKGLGLRRFSKSITAGICGRRNGYRSIFAANFQQCNVNIRQVSRENIRRKPGQFPRKASRAKWLKSS